MRLLLTSLLVLIATCLSTDSASAQSIRVSQCCGHTKIVQKGSGFGFVAPMQSYGAIQTFGTVPVQTYGSIQTFGFAPIQGFGTVPYGAQFGASPSGSQYGNPLGMLAAQYGIEFVVELISHLKGSSQNGGGSLPNSGSNEKPLIIPQSKNPATPPGITPGGVDLSGIDQKLNAILTLQALNTGTSAKILETVMSSDKKLDEALQLLNDIKPKAVKVK